MVFLFRFYRLLPLACSNSQLTSKTMKSVRYLIVILPGRGIGSYQGLCNTEKCFEWDTNLVLERSKTVHGLDCAETVIGLKIVQGNPLGFEECSDQWKQAKMQWLQNPRRMEIVLNNVRCETGLIFRRC